MPTTALLIQREILREGRSVEEIVQSVEEAAAKTLRIDQEMALFGLAVYKRQQGQDQEAIQLLQHAKPATNPLLKEAVDKEVALLQEEIPPHSLVAEKVMQRPNVDGQIDDTGVWEQAEPYALAMEDTVNSASWTAQARFIHDNSQLYILVDGTNAVGEEPFKKQTFKVHINPGRDYTTLRTYELVLEKRDEVRINRERVIQQQAGVDELALAGQEKEVTINGVWTYQYHQENATEWSAEFSIPLLEIAEPVDGQVRGVLINLVRNAEGEGQTKTAQSLAGQENESRILGFPYLYIK
jgi:hypothetical protein